MLSEQQHFQMLWALDGQLWSSKDTTRHYEVLTYAAQMLPSSLDKYVTEPTTT